MESLAAVLAGIRPCVRVDQQVCGEGGRAFKQLPTHVTLELSLLKRSHAVRVPFISSNFSINYLIVHIRIMLFTRTEVLNNVQDDYENVF